MDIHVNDQNIEESFISLSIKGRENKMFLRKDLYLSEMKYKGGYK